jgi:hypothetical protein
MPPPLPAPPAPRPRHVRTPRRRGGGGASFGAALALALALASSALHCADAKPLTLVRSQPLTSVDPLVRRRFACTRRTRPHTRAGAAPARRSASGEGHMRRLTRHFGLRRMRRCARSATAGCVQ